MVTEKYIRWIAEQYEKTGRVAVVHPRRKDVMVDGIDVPYFEAKEKMVRVLADSMDGRTFRHA